MGIPIELPGWTQAVAWIFLLLLAAAVGVGVYNAMNRNKDREILSEIHAKASLTLMVLRNWQEERQEWVEPVAEHRAEEEPVLPAHPEGTYFYNQDTETTAPQGRLVQ